MGDPGYRLVDLVDFVPPLDLPHLQHLMEQLLLPQPSRCHQHLWIHKWEMLMVEEGGESARLPPIRYASLMFVGEGYPMMIWN